MNDVSEVARTDVTQETVHQLEMIRRALVRTRGEGDQSALFLQTTWKTQVLIQVIGGALAIGLCGLELLTNEFTVRALRASMYDSVYRVGGLINVAVMLVVLSAVLLFLVFRAARISARERQHYIARNFAYLTNLSFFSDLLLKYTGFCIVISSLHPEWCGPLFTLFIGDYLIQGRLFVVELRLSLILGTAAFTTAIAMFASGNPSILIPASFYAVAAAASLMQLWHIRPSKPARVNP